MAKILHISKFYFPFRGGLEKVAQDFCEGLIDANHQVKVLCASHNKKRQVETIGGVEVIRLQTFGVFASQPLIPSIFIHLYHHLKWADIVHLHGPNPLAEMALALLSFWVKRPVIVSHQSDIVKQRFLLKLYRPFQRLFYLTSDIIIVPTINHIVYSDVIQDIYFKTQIIPIALRPNPSIDFEKVHEERKTIKKKYGEYILFTGRLVGYKGLRYLIEALENLPYKLLIVGEGIQGPALKEMVREKGIESRIHFLGGIASNEQFEALMAECSLFVLPSITKNENFGVVQLEAMAHGKAVISTNLKSGSSTIVHHEVTGFLVKPACAQDLADKISLIMGNEILRKKMGLAGKKRFEEMYTYKKMLSPYLELIHSILDKKHSLQGALPTLEDERQKGDLKKSA